MAGVPEENIVELDSEFAQVEDSEVPEQEGSQIDPPASAAAEVTGSNENSPKSERLTSPLLS